MTRGAILALASAALFGVSPPAIKAWSGELPPFLLAGLLYLGAGASLLALGVLRGKVVLAPLRSLRPREVMKLAGAVVTGGLLAPICLAISIRGLGAYEVSLLLNLETVATTVLAALLFGEHVGARVWSGKILVLLGAALLVLQPGQELRLSLPALAVLAACVLWGLDNNLTRDLEDLPAETLAMLRGLVAGSVNVGLGWLLGETGASSVDASAVSLALAVGAVSYGFSLVLFIHALRLIGASRTSTYFATGPFAGMLAALLFLGEQPTSAGWAAAALMAAGALWLAREAHAHEHEHGRLEHSHRHSHGSGEDGHHEHSHGGEGVFRGAHEHSHIHEPQTHQHPHLPDIHHRHSH